MQKKVVLFFLIMFIGCLFCLLKNSLETNDKILKSKKEENIVSANAISMLYETEVGSGEYQTSTDTMWPQDGYIFNERLSGCENGGTLSWNEETKRVIMQTNKSDKCYVYFDKEPDIVYFADYIKELYTTQGENGLYYHDISLANGAADNSYRYAGANPNNYVCFGSDAEVCPEDNLYRIIGVFDEEVKLIRATSIGNYAWDSNGNNTWSTATIRNILNTTYYNSLNATWQNKIATHTWKVGGMDHSVVNKAKQYYDVEAGSGSSSTTDSMKIGLMYVSDYGFAASNSNWTTALALYKYSDSSTNWLYLGTYEWTISPRLSTGSSVFSLYDLGYVYYDNAYNGYSARPVFYLNSNVTYVSGDGTESNPYRIS